MAKSIESSTPLYGDGLHLEPRTEKQRPRYHKCARRKGLREERTIDLVPGIEKNDIGTEHLHGDDIIHGHPALRQYGPEWLENDTRCRGRVGKIERAHV